MELDMHVMPLDVTATLYSLTANRQYDNGDPFGSMWGPEVLC